MTERFSAVILNKQNISKFNSISLFYHSFSIRGRLGSITPLARNVGVLIGYTVGAVVEYEQRPFIFVFFPVMYLFWLYSLPNTPQHYLHRGDYQVSTFSYELAYTECLNVKQSQEIYSND